SICSNLHSIYPTTDIRGSSMVTDSILALGSSTIFGMLTILILFILYGISAGDIYIAGQRPDTSVQNPLIKNLIYGVVISSASFLTLVVIWFSSRFRRMNYAEKTNNHTQSSDVK